jgi:hypothetical protein
MKILEGLSCFLLILILFAFTYCKLEEIRAKTKFYERSTIDIRINNIRDLFDSDFNHIDYTPISDVLCGS